MCAMKMELMFFTALLLKFTSSMTVPDISIAVGRTAIFPCPRATPTTISHQWQRRNENSNSQGSAYTTLTDGLSVYHDRMAVYSENYSLEIRNTTYTDTGTYRCMVESSSGVWYTDLSLTVKDEDVSVDTSTVVDVRGDVNTADDGALNTTERIQLIKSGISIVYVVIVPLALGVFIILTGGTAAVLYVKQHYMCVPRNQFSETIIEDGNLNGVSASGRSAEQDTSFDQYQQLTENRENNCNEYADIAKKNTAEGLLRQSGDANSHIYDECGKAYPKQNMYQSLIKGNGDAAQIYD